jgi:hypothetical protein
MLQALDMAQFVEGLSERNKELSQAQLITAQGLSNTKEQYVVQSLLLF